MDIDERTVMSPVEVLDHLQEMEDVGQVQRDTREHLTKHLAVQNVETYEELYGELEGLDSFRDEHIIKIIETLPRSEQEVRALFSKERVKLDDGDIDAIVDFTESVGTH